MKKKLLIVLFMFISFSIGVSITIFVFSILDDEKFSLCHKILLTPQEKQAVLSKYKPTLNPFFSIPDWYDKEDLLKTKNFYIQNESNENDESICLSSKDIYSWSDNAYLEFEDGSIYKVGCNK